MAHCTLASTTNLKRAHAGNLLNFVENLLNLVENMLTPAWETVHDGETELRTQNGSRMMLSSCK